MPLVAGFDSSPSVGGKWPLGIMEVSMMDFEQRIATLRAEFTAYQQRFGECRADWSQIEGEPKEWRVLGYAQRIDIEGDIQSREEVTILCWKAGSLLAEMRGDSIGDPVVYWLCELPDDTTECAENFTKDGKFVNLSWRGSKFRLAEKSELRLHQLEAELPTLLAAGDVGPTAQNAIDQHARTELVDGTNKQKVEWKQKAVDGAVQRKIDEHHEAFAAARRGEPGGLKTIKKIFRRNTLARAIDPDRPPNTQLSKSAPWLAIAEEFNLPHGKRQPAGRKIGHDIAVEQQSKANGDTTAAEVDLRDLNRAIEDCPRVSSKEKQAIMDNLATGEQTPEQAAAMLELLKESVS
jgi:hypothetical protein